MLVCAIDIFTFGTVDVNRFRIGEDRNTIRAWRRSSRVWFQHSRTFFSFPKDRYWLLGCASILVRVSSRIFPLSRYSRFVKMATCLQQAPGIRMSENLLFASPYAIKLWCLIWHSRESSLSQHHNGGNQDSNYFFLEIEIGINWKHDSVKFCLCDIDAKNVGILNYWNCVVEGRLNGKC
jgi:hypothetical protein